MYTSPTEIFETEAVVFNCAFESPVENAKNCAPLVDPGTGLEDGDVKVYVGAAERTRVMVGPGSVFVPVLRK